MSTPYHVERTRVADTSVSFTCGGVPATPGVGSVPYSRTYPSAAEAQCEADAWNGEGAYTRSGPTDWKAVVVPGPAPQA